MTDAKTAVSPPCFLVGAERSGTTLLRLMLNGHPHVAWRNEFEYAVDLLQAEEGWPPLSRYRTWLATHRVFQGARLKIDPDLDYPQLVRSFLEQTRGRAGKAHVGATVHRNFDKLPRIWPEAKFIHIVRDGRDVARSGIGMGWSGNVWTGAARWIEAERTWEEARGSIHESRRLELRYESLIREPTATLEQLCDFIGVAYDPGMLDYHHVTTFDLPNSDLVSQWRTKLSRRDLQLVEARLGDLLVERGYELSGLPRRSVGRATRLALALQNGWARRLSRMRAFGFGLVLADFLSRRLGLARWQSRVQVRMNAITDSGLSLKPCCYDVMLRVGMRPSNVPGRSRELSSDQLGHARVT